MTRLGWSRCGAAPVTDTVGSASLQDELKVMVSIERDL